MLQNGVGGCCTIPLYAKYLIEDDNPKYDLGLDHLQESGITSIASVRYHYATDDGGDGTVPPQHRWQVFEDMVVQLMRNNSGVLFSWLNEWNNPREQPREADFTPELFVRYYNLLWSRKPRGAMLGPGAIDPFNAQVHSWGDWRQTWGWVLENIDGADFLSYHAYCHGPGPDVNQVWGDKQFGHPPLVGVYYDIRVLESQQEIVPARFRGLPQYVTEFNHFMKRNGTMGWDTDAGEFVEECYKYFGQRGITGATAFRYNYDVWRMDDKPRLLEAFK
jgi:hypothetical protein